MNRFLSKFKSSDSYLIFFYPAASYTVKFYDGVIQTVKGIHVKPFTKEVYFAFVSHSCCTSISVLILTFSPFTHSLILTK